MVGPPPGVVSPILNQIPGHSEHHQSLSPYRMHSASASSGVLLHVVAVVQRTVSPHSLLYGFYAKSISKRPVMLGRGRIYLQSCFQWKRRLAELVSRSENLGSQCLLRALVWFLQLCNRSFSLLWTSSNFRTAAFWIVFTSFFSMIYTASSHLGRPS